MSPDLPQTVLPAAALVFPLATGVALLASGGSALPGDPRRGSSDSGSVSDLVAWSRVLVGALLLASSGIAFSTAAVVAVALCAVSLGSALESFVGADAHRGGALRVAGASALLAFAVVAALEGLLGYDGVPSALLSFEIHDLSWAAALLGVLTLSTLLQLGRTGEGRGGPRIGVPAADGDGAAPVLDSWTRG